MLQHPCCDALFCISTEVIEPVLDRSLVTAHAVPTSEKLWGGWAGRKGETYWKRLHDALFETHCKLATYNNFCQEHSNGRCSGMCLYASPLVDRVYCTLLIHRDNYMHIGVGSNVVCLYQKAMLEPRFVNGQQGMFTLSLCLSVRILACHKESPIWMRCQMQT